MRILGIDPGIGRLGWGVIEAKGQKLEIVDCGCIETSPKLSVEKRLLQIDKELNTIIKDYKPEFVALEDLFFGNNAKTAFVVGQARGVVLLCAGKFNLPISVYTPLQVKIATSGYGRADKSQVSKMVKVLLRLEKMPKLDDTVDALAIALTHSFSAKVNKTFSSS